MIAQLLTTKIRSRRRAARLHLQFSSKLWPLPVGESMVTAYLVSKTYEWKEVARFTLRVVKERSSLSQTESGTSLSEETELTEKFLKAKYSGAAAPTSDDKQTAVAGGADGQRPTSTPQASAAKVKKIKFTPSLTLAMPSQPAQSTFPGPQPERATVSQLNLQASLKNEATYGIFSSQSSFDFAGSSFEKEALRFGILGKDAPKVDLSSYDSLA